VKMFDAGITRMIGLPYGEKTMKICSAVFIWYRNVTDRQTDRFAISISRVSMLTRDKNLPLLLYRDPFLLQLLAVSSLYHPA